MPAHVDNIYSLLAVVIPSLVPAILALLAYLQSRVNSTKIEEAKSIVRGGLEEVKSQVVEVHSIINSGAEVAKAQSHAEGKAEGRAEAQAESESNAAAQAHNAERTKR